MKASRIIVAAAALLLLLIGCEGVLNNTPIAVGSGGAWLIPSDEIRDGGPGKDGIPALSNPRFLTADQADYLGDDHLVLAMKHGDVVKVYPHPILDWHEIINDEVGPDKVAVTYCPLTGSGIAWNRVLDGVETTFGVSGLLYNSNLIPYDRDTDSNWSQMLMLGVQGDHSGMAAELFPIVETTWGFFREQFPDLQVVSSSTGYNRDYGRYPYGTYRTGNSLIFGVSNEDRRLERKERVLGVLVDGMAYAFRFKDFPDDVTVHNLTLNGTPIVVFGSRANNFLVAYERTSANGLILEFEPSGGGSPALVMDQEGSEWSLFGEAVGGPRLGERLRQTRGYIAYWFAWGAFWPGTEILELSGD